MTFKGPKLTATEEVLAKLDPPPKILVELGGYVGVSAVAWAPMLKRLDQSRGNAKVQVFSLELEPEFVQIIDDFVRMTGQTETTRVVQGRSADLLRKLKQDGTIDHIDVLFLDHWEDCYVPDVRLCEDLGLLRKGSVIVADNTDIPGAPAYLEYMRAGGENGWKYRSEEVKVDAGRGPVSMPVDERASLTLFRPLFILHTFERRLDCPRTVAWSSVAEMG